MKLGNIFKIVKFIVQYPRVEPCTLRQDANSLGVHIVARSIRTMDVAKHISGLI